jgi:5-methylcytosine-specific restriction protein A
MWQPDPSALAAQLSAEFGLSFSAKAGSDPQGHLYITPDGVHRNDGFCIRIELGWRSVKASFIPGPFAGDLISEMGAAAPQKQNVFANLVQRSEQDGAAVSMKVNGNAVSPVDPGTWPDSWRNIELALQKSPVAINTEDAEENDHQLYVWSRKFVGIAIALLPLAMLEESIEPNPEGLPEGACIRVEVNRYERNRLNRVACLEIHGTNCKACGFNFGKTYGALAEGFIHVHHIVPVSELGGSYIINPARDLVPLCPNCHAIAHLRTPPFEVSEIAELLKSGGLEQAGRAISRTAFQQKVETVDE